MSAIRKLFRRQTGAAILLAAAAAVPCGRVNGQTGPFNGFAPALPATLECEQYNLGGQNVGFLKSQATANQGGKFRSDGAVGPDIYRCADKGGLRGYCVGGCQQGDYLAYTVNNLESAPYTIEVRARCPLANYSSTFHFEWNGVRVPGSVTLWYPDVNWHTVTTTAYLTAGTAVLKLVIDSADALQGAGYFDYITIYKTPPSFTNPSGGNHTVTVTTLTPNLSDWQTARANALILQDAIDNLVPADGGTVIVQGAGPFFLAQAIPKETIPVAGGPLRPALVAAVGLGGTAYNNYDGWLGFRFQVGSQPITVTSLGRWVVSSSYGWHTLQIFDPSGNPVTEVLQVDLSGKPAGAFYFQTSQRTALQAGATYNLVSSESNYGDQWYDYPGTQITLTLAATAATAAHGATPASISPPAGPPNPTGQSYGPVNLQYEAIPALTSDNYAVLVRKSNVTIQGGTGGTILAAHDRATTLLYVGSGYYGLPAGSQAVNNIILQNVTFQGNPLHDFTGQYNETGLYVVEDIYHQNADIGALVVIGGYAHPVFGTNYTQNVVVQNCVFYNPSTVGLSLLFDTDVLIQNCSVTYFNGITPASLVNSVKAWCGLLAQYPVYDVAVLQCGFNGNVNMANNGDYATDGLINFKVGGKWVVQDCPITNYRLEGLSLAAGPFTAVGNTFTTLGNNIASVALCTMHNDRGNSLSSAQSLYSAYCFVDNTIGAGGAPPGSGLLGVRDPNGDWVNGTVAPYHLLVSANEFNLTRNNPYPANPSYVLMTACSENVAVTGNVIDYANHAVYYGTLAGYNANNQPCAITALCNDFSPMTHTSFFTQDAQGKLQSVHYTANRLGSGYFEHVHLELSQYTKPYLTLEGNQFGVWGVSPFVTSHQYWNNYRATGWYGCGFQVGGQQLVATYLGRWKRPGNVNQHTLRLVDANANVLGSVTLDTAYQPDNEFAFAWLSTPVTLNAGTTYYLASSEVSTGDDWDQWETVSTSGATPLGPAWSPDGSGFSIPYPYPNSMHGPVNFISCRISPAPGPWSPYGPAYQQNATQQYWINNPSLFADSTFSRF